MLTHSTVESVEARQPTWLAIFEALLSIAIYVFIAWRCKTYVHFVVAAVFAPLFLLRTKESTEWLHEIYLKVGNWVLGLFDESRMSLSKIFLFPFWLFCSAFTFAVLPFVLRLMSLFYWIFARPLESIKAIPGNWFQQAFCIDIFFAPELMPGENINAARNGDKSDLPTLGEARKLFLETLKSNRYKIPATILGFFFFSPIFFSYLSSFLYRIGFKATSVFYFPLVWVSNVGVNDGRPIYERLARFSAGELEKSRRTLSVIIAPVVMLKMAVMFGFADLRTAVEKIVESSWLVFIRPLLEYLFSPGLMAWWVVAIMVEIVLTFVLFFFSDEALARKDGAKPWPDTRVEAVASALITLRSAVAVLLVCSGVAFAMSAYIKAT